MHTCKQTHLRATDQQLQFLGSEQVDKRWVVRHHVEATTKCTELPVHHLVEQEVCIQLHKLLTKETGNAYVCKENWVIEANVFIKWASLLQEKQIYCFLQLFMVGKRVHSQYWVLILRNIYDSCMICLDSIQSQILITIQNGTQINKSKNLHYKCQLVIYLSISITSKHSKCKKKAKNSDKE